VGRAILCGGVSERAGESMGGGSERVILHKVKSRLRGERRLL
jgi:hypothetical protein